MTWLYKGAYSCAFELGLDQETLGFLQFPISMIKLLKQNNIKPICVFDGMRLKAKEATDTIRANTKTTNKEIAMKMMETGNIDEARKYFSRSLSVTMKMVYLLIDILRELEVQVIMAPYEADSQIAYLVKEGLADFAISEDSDLTAWGCPRLLTKLNWAGDGKLFSMSEFKKDN